MQSITRNGIRLGLVTGLVVTGVVGVTSLAASGTGDASMAPHYGTLTLLLADQAGSLTLEQADGKKFTQALSAQTPCSTLATGGILEVNGDNSEEPVVSTRTCSCLPTESVSRKAPTAVNPQGSSDPVKR